MPSLISVRCAASIQSCTVFLGVLPTMSLLFSFLVAREYAYAAFGLFMPFFHPKTSHASLLSWLSFPFFSLLLRTSCSLSSASLLFCLLFFFSFFFLFFSFLLTTL